MCELRDKVKWYEGDDGSMSSLKCSGKLWTSTKKSDDRNCKISSKDEMISCQCTTRCREACRSCRVCRTKKSSSAKRMWASGLKNMDNLGLSSKTRDAHKIQSESLVEAELDQEIRPEMTGEGAVHPNQMGVAWPRPSCRVSSRQEQTWPDNSWHFSRMSSKIRMECSISQRQSILCMSSKRRREMTEETKIEEDHRKPACREYGPPVPGGRNGFWLVLFLDASMW